MSTSALGLCIIYLLYIVGSSGTCGCISRGLPPPILFLSSTMALLDTAVTLLLSKDCSVRLPGQPALLDNIGPGRLFTRDFSLCTSPKISMYILATCYCIDLIPDFDPDLHLGLVHKLRFRIFFFFWPGPLGSTAFTPSTVFSLQFCLLQLVAC